MSRKDASVTDPNTWLESYGQLRAHGPGHPSEWLGTPLAIAGLVGWLWSLPTPDGFSQAGSALNWGTVFLMATVVYYFILSISLAFGALPFIVAVATLNAWLERSALPLAEIACTTFALAVIWQLAECRRTGAGAGAFRHIQHILIGPLWILAAIYRRAGIPY